MQQIESMGPELLALWMDCRSKPFSFISGLTKWTMIYGSIVRAETVKVEKWGDATYLQAAPIATMTQV